MSQRNMLKYSAGVLLLLLWLGDLVIGEISDDFSKCSQFFYKNTPPLGINAEGYQPICQRYKNQYRFASLYHRQHRTPLYSAYILSPGGKRPKQVWKYEPQLVSSTSSADMKPFPKTIPNEVRDSQAVPRDYTNSGYTKGHLNPSMHQLTEEDRKATFTLTNVVPQHEISNRDTWNKLWEWKVLDRFSFCMDTMYVITGVIPYQSEPRWINNRVSVPEYMWSAYCCQHYGPLSDESMKPFFPTYAAVGRNDPNSGDEIVPKASVSGYDVRQMPLGDLEDILRKVLGMKISLFVNQCRKPSRSRSSCNSGEKRDGCSVRQMPIEILEDILKTMLGIDIVLFARQCLKESSPTVALPFICTPKKSRIPIQEL